MREPRFLIIDADPVNRRKLGRLLDELGQNTDRPENPRKAAELLKKTDYDCVLVDRDIPDEWSEFVSAGIPTASPLPIFMVGPKDSESPSALEINTADGYLHRDRDSIERLTEDVRKGIARILSARTHEATYTEGKFAGLNRCTESLSDQHIFVRTSRISGKGPREDIALVADLGQGRYNMLLGDFTGPGKLADLDYLRLTHRMGCSLQENTTPDILFAELNSELLTSQPSIDFVTAAALHVDLERKKLAYTVAGHLPPLHRRWGRARWKILHGSGIPLGIRDGENFPVHEMRLEPGDKILLMSDGFLKMRGPSGGLTDIGQAVAGIDELPVDAAPHEIIEGIDDIVMNVAGSRDVGDEITFMLIQI